jgi:hypothetical protein
MYTISERRPVCSKLGESRSSNRQAPHYYEPYFEYLSSYIMSYALHVDLDKDHSYTASRVV